MNTCPHVYLPLPLLLLCCSPSFNSKLQPGWRVVQESRCKKTWADWWLKHWRWSLWRPCQWWWWWHCRWWWWWWWCTPRCQNEEDDYLCDRLAVSGFCEGRFDWQLVVFKLYDSSLNLEEGLNFVDQPSQSNTSLEWWKTGWPLFEDRGDHAEALMSQSGQNKEAIALEALARWPKYFQGFFPALWSKF